MNEPQQSATAPAFTVRLDFAPDDPAHADWLRISSVARSTVTDLHAQGFAVAAAQTGAKSVDAFTVVQQIAASVYENKAVLIALAGLATPMINHLLAQHDEEEEPPPTVTINIDGVTQALQVSSKPTNEEVLAQLLAIEPKFTAPLTPASNYSVRVGVPAKA